jgi:hypothetical protein
MWYSGGGMFAWRIGHATSTDRITWTKDANNPVLDVGASGQWDDAYVGACSILFDDANSTWKMWYNGGRAPMNGSIGYATRH